MQAGLAGTFVISWAQTELDGLAGAPLGALRVGAAWAWQGDPVRVDGPAGLWQLTGALGTDALRRRAARGVTKLVGAALDGAPAPAPPPADDSPLPNRAFVVTDGARSYTLTLIDAGGPRAPLLLLPEDWPPRARDLWVVRETIGPGGGRRAGSGDGVICFAAGTRINTPDGLRPVEDLAPGDRVITKDSGAQRIAWVGRRRMTGARLFAMPRLRPVRLGPGALGAGRPDGALLVSPQHRLLVKSDAARDLFGERDVLVAARDLVDGAHVRVDLSVREVTYIHLLLPRHEVLWANGVETESFHPAAASMAALAEADRARLLALDPGLETNPHRYGGFARRTLTAAEAAILRHAGRAHPGRAAVQLPAA